jgi:CspA family cold shock protein
MSTENNEIQREPETPSTDYTVIIERLTGTVKWFNNKAGFGFITVCEEGDYQDKDIFVHYSSIRVSNSQYKYLVQGEYVDFTLVKANNGHEFQAMNVSGIKGGPIMCESRRVMTPIGFQPRESQNGPPANKLPKKNENTKNTRNKPSPESNAESNTGDSLLEYTTVSKKRRPPRTNMKP